MSTPTARFAPEDLEKLWTSLGVDDGQGSIVGSTIMPPTSAEQPAAETSLLERGGVELIEPIAEGGMAMVHRGKQRGLRREVAVKVLKPEADTPMSRARLLREARLTGSLEHPNIVPVHALSMAPSGEPQLLMKRIDGISWRAFMAAPDARADALAGETAIEKNLDVLMQVAKAVHYAHRRGIVHRDIKPENVMIGRFGDVYLLDWGIAVRVGERATVRPEGVAGTPGYMAPEMIGTADMAISPRTDIFLLGAVLHELLTGEPPHAADSVHKAMFRAYRAEPHTYDPDVPTDLASICWRAMARTPEERFPDAEAFRLAVADHLKHRNSTALAAEAEESLHLLKRAITRPDPEPAEVYHHFGAARFGFEYALRQWSENLPAHRGLQSTLERLIDYELAAGHAATAQALYAELPAPSRILAERISVGLQVEQAQTMEVEALRALERDIAPQIGAHTRARVALGLGAVLGALAMGAGAFARYFLPGGIQPRHYLPHGLVLFLITALFLFSNRRALQLNQLNKRISQMTLLMMGGGLVFRGMVVVAGLPVMPMLPLEFVLYALAIAMMGFATHRRLAWAALPALFGAAAMVATPGLAFEIAGATVFVALASMAAVWKRDADQPLPRPSTSPPPIAPPAPTERFPAIDEDHPTQVTRRPPASPL